jgi:hypothetical protein
MKFPSAILSFLLAGGLFAGEVRPIDGKLFTLYDNGGIVPGGRSPDGRFEVATLFYDGTTATTIGIITADKTKLLQDLPAITSNMTNEPYAKWLTLRWSADSRMLAVHDTTRKHSVLSVFREQDGNFSQVELPDLTAEVQKLAPRIGGKVFSSGQRPLRWASAERLTVELRAAGKAAGKPVVKQVNLVFPPGKKAILETPKVGKQK